MVSMHLKTPGRCRKYCQSICGEKPAGEDAIPLAGPDKNTKCYTSFLDTGTTTGGFDAVFTANGAYPDCS